MIEIRNLVKRYGEKTVLSVRELDLPQGEFTVLMGPSGSGKTTLAHICLGILEPDEGTVRGLEGKTLAAVFQEDRLCEQLSAVSNIRLVLDPQVERVEILRQLARVGLGKEEASRPVSRLSGGQKRRVALVRAAMARRDFTCLDEPFKGLDEETRAQAIRYVLEAFQGRTVLLITHDKEEAEAVDGRLEELPGTFLVVAD